MNYQKKPPKEVVKIFHKFYTDEIYGIDYYAWPMTFGSTSGPVRYIGGQTISVFTIEAWVLNSGGPTIYTCNGMYYFENKKFEPFTVNPLNWLQIPKGD